MNELDKKALRMALGAPGGDRVRVVVSLVVGRERFEASMEVDPRIIADGDVEPGHVARAGLAGVKLGLLGRAPKGTRYGALREAEKVARARGADLPDPMRLGTELAAQAIAELSGA